ncbi:cation:proton antiporter [Spirulina sp. 06S082]|uniref:cation:proton antiporter domain-containing protein n=1 Tax=Spirulina sp. 06S082 TaxID=3110248 RepID=UPI002B215012|nr:cation:proton antiporter [Spirulina sp. 06S082]MEA5470640.1 cation:proton antiporter [Spirulina sp. 06S082]
MTLEAIAEHKFILDLTAVLCASAIGGYLANRLRQPVLLGYLFSGFLIGPFGLGLLKELNEIKSLAEIGVAFLLFTLGVEFSLAELKRVKEIAIQGSLLQIGFTIILVTLTTTILGLVQDIPQGIFLGAILSLSSTAVVLKTLTERGEINTQHGQVMLAILIAQDLALGVMLAILPALNNPESLVPSLFISLLKAVLFFTAALISGYWIVPPVIRKVAETENSELFLLSVITLCLGVALITAALGLSIEMGAFVAGLMVAEIEHSDQALTRIVPLRDTFASLFFASIGMLIQPQIMVDNIGVILGMVAFVMIGKALIIFPIIIGFNYSFKTAIIASFGLNQIGEFSFVLALTGMKLGFLSERQYLLLLGTTAITLVLTPIGMKFAPRLADKLLTIPLIKYYLRKLKGRKAFAKPKKISGHVVVAGYGRVGRVIVKILRDRGYPVLAIENSEAAIQRLKQEEIPYIFGDGDSEWVLEGACLEDAVALAIALPDPASTRLLVKHALEIAPHLDIVARSHRDGEIDMLTQMGAQEVVQPEFEAGLEIGSHILAALGQGDSEIQSAIQDIRSDRYTSIRPQRSATALRQDVNKVASSLHNEWLSIPEASPLHDLTLADVNVKKLTGVTILVLQKASETVYYPSEETILESSDRLLVMGKRSEVAAFRKLLEGRQ